MAAMRPAPGTILVQPLAHRAPVRAPGGRPAAPRHGAWLAAAVALPVARRAARRAFDRESWCKGFLEPEEVDEGFYFLENIDLPQDLSGTFFRNGPGKFKAGNDTVVHELDGDGLVLAISFMPEEKQVCVRYRLVQTQGLLRDIYAKRLFAKGFHGTPAGEGGLGLDPRKDVPKHTANATVVQWEEKLLAVGHFGKPFELDAASLSTVLGNEDEGSWNMDGALDESGMGSSPKVCGTEECLTFIAQSPSALGTTVRYLEFAPGSWRPRYPRPRQISVGGFTRFADFAITPKWFVVCKPPLKMDGFAAAMGKTFSEVLEDDMSGTSELIFATRLRKEEEEVTVPVDRLLVEEFVNAYEEGDRVVLDLVASDAWDGRAAGQPRRWEGAQVPRRRLVRYEVDLKSKTWSKTEGPLQKDLGFTSVNPGLNGLKHRFVFGATSHEDTGPAQGGIAKLDRDSGALDEWLLGPSEWCGEPLFVAKPGNDAEDGGYLVTVVFDGQEQRSDVVVLDAAKVSEGPVARFALRSPVPHGQRGCWVPEMTFTQEEMKRKVTLMRMFAKKSKEWNAVDLGFSAMGKGALFQKQGTKMR